MFSDQQNFQQQQQPMMMGDFQQEQQNYGYQPQPQQNFQQMGYASNSLPQNYQSNQNYQQPSPTEQQAMQIDYSSYDQLPFLNNSQNLSEMVQSIQDAFNTFNKKNWMSQFSAINYIRIINKNCPNDINNIFQTFGKNILDCIDGTQTQTKLQKNALLLMTEIFFNCNPQSSLKLDDQVICAILPILFQRTFSEKLVIKNEAKQCLETFAQRCFFYDQAFVSICNLCFDKNSIIQTNAIVMLAKMLNSLQGGIQNLKYETLSMLMQALTKLLVSKNSQSKQYSKQIVIFIANLVGNENFQNIINHVLGEGERQTMFQIMQKQKKEYPRVSKQQLSNYKQQNYLKFQQQNNDEIKEFGMNKISCNLGNIFNQQGSGYNNNNQLLQQQPLQQISQNVMMNQQNNNMYNGGGGFYFNQNTNNANFSGQGAENSMNNFNNNNNSCFQQNFNNNSNPMFGNQQFQQQQQYQNYLMNNNTNNENSCNSQFSFGQPNSNSNSQQFQKFY